MIGQRLTNQPVLFLLVRQLVSAPLTGVLVYETSSSKIAFELTSHDSGVLENTDYAQPSVFTSCEQNA